MAMTTTERARIAAYGRAYKCDTVAIAKAGQAGLKAAFLAQARTDFPDLPTDEQAKKADWLWKQHMARARAARGKGKRKHPSQ